VDKPAATPKLAVNEIFDTVHRARANERKNARIHCELRVVTHIFVGLLPVNSGRPALDGLSSVSRTGTL
jgi:hypothetical protein